VATVTRDYRRALIWRWRMLECEAANPTRLPTLWAKWYGVTPQFGGEGSAFSFVHFRLDARTRLIAPLRPTTVEVPGALVAMAASLLGVKYGCQARLARPAEIGRAPTVRAPSHDDAETVEEFPVGNVHEPVVGEYEQWPGWLVVEDESGAVTGTTDPNEATRFTRSAARSWIAEAAPGRRPRIALRYLPAVRAEIEQRETANVYDGF
jgi:hypothetical protein